MKSSRAQIALGLLSTLLSGTAQADPALAGSEWQPSEIAGSDVPAEPEMFVRFAAEGRLEGHGGCNAFFGSYQLAGDKIEIGPLGATRRACEEPVMDRELRLFEELGKATSWARDGIHLSLSDASGEISIRLVQRDAD